MYQNRLEEVASGLWSTTPGNNGVEVLGEEEVRAGPSPHGFWKEYENKGL
jgi:hypothetical protein